jgi:hypothetical protein
MVDLYRRIKTSEAFRQRQERVKTVKWLRLWEQNLLSHNLFIVNATNAEVM